MARSAGTVGRDTLRGDNMKEPDWLPKRTSVKREGSGNLKAPADGEARGAARLDAGVEIV